MISKIATVAVYVEDQREKTEVLDRRHVRIASGGLL